MLKIATAAAAILALLAFAGSASANPRGQLVEATKACLLRHGATHVDINIDGSGGYVWGFKDGDEHRYAMWRYLESSGRITGVTYRFSTTYYLPKRKAMTLAHQAIVKNCVMRPNLS